MARREKEGETKNASLQLKYTLHECVRARFPFRFIEFVRGVHACMCLSECGKGVTYINLIITIEMVCDANVKI